MKPQVIIDAGPALNFCSINKEGLLLDVVQTLSTTKDGVLKAPETVDTEVLNKAKSDHRFAGSDHVWKKLRASRYLDILPDDPSHAALSRAVTRISGQPLAVRHRQAKDLGEHMVLAHAAVMVEAGTHVTVLIDDGPGQALAATEIRRYRALAAAHGSIGNYYLLSTPQVLLRAIKTTHIPDKAEMRKIYTRMRGLDDGLKPIERTTLLTDPRW